MEVEQLSLIDACLIRFPVHKDERGYFTRIRCADAFAEIGLPVEFVQANLSYNARAATFRGLHYQVPPSTEGKLVRCIAGAIDDLIVDLRPNSLTFLKHQWIRLEASEMCALYVPTGFAHGFITASNDSTVMYDMSDYYAPQLSRGMRWNDAALNISLPRQIEVINERDAAYADLDLVDLECFSQ
ncbi:MAG: dTDP-4-dehydrorhamnose 3,5-epimerase family protein [Pseudomonadales bacterium]